MVNTAARAPISPSASSSSSEEQRKPSGSFEPVWVWASNDSSGGSEATTASRHGRSRSSAYTSGVMYGPGERKGLTGDGERPADGARRVLPPPGGQLGAHACRRSDDVRRAPAAPRRGGRGDPQPPAPRAPLPPEARVRAVRPGPAALGGRSPLQPPLPRPPHGAPRARHGGSAQAARRPGVLT